MTDEQASSPHGRSSSPSSDASPTTALPQRPALERCVSTASSFVSSVSGRSASGQSYDGQNGKRRGYKRPQATGFADSARNRDSVMSLGSIAHLQCYFARTGLLDGKGGQLARDQNKEDGTEGARSPSGSQTPPDIWGSLSPTDDEAPYLASRLDFGSSPFQPPALTEASSEQSSSFGDWEDSHVQALPPTFSTYKNKPIYVLPPPNVDVLRRELRESLEDASKLLVELDQQEEAGSNDSDADPTSSQLGSPQKQQWYSIQGLQVLDLITLAIRAAKNYYTAHELPQRLYALKSERNIRSDLYTVLEVLKRMATRNFAGGVKQSEKNKIREWIVSIEELLSKEEEVERKERNEREKWTWRDGNWSGREREREWLFLKSFDDDTAPLPYWNEPQDDVILTSSFLASLQTGLRLVRLHNKLVKASKRQFGEIKAFHVDTTKPYRCAENLRYWIKAAELRFDVKLEVNVACVVHGDNAPAWRSFDGAILQWCEVVREELTSEWQGQQKLQTPVVRMDEGPAEPTSVAC